MSESVDKAVERLRQRSSSHLAGGTLRGDEAWGEWPIGSRLADMAATARECARLARFDKGSWDSEMFSHEEREAAWAALDGVAEWADDLATALEGRED